MLTRAYQLDDRNPPVAAALRESAGGTGPRADRFGDPAAAEQLLQQR